MLPTLSAPRPSRPETPPVPLAPGDVVAGAYRVEAQLGAGAMAAVFRAAVLAGGPDVALKVLHPEAVRDPSTVGRFRREARAAQQLDHPNIVRVLDFGEHEGRPFMAMELLEGRDLFDVLASEGSLPEDRAVRVALQICDALACAHAAGVVHRDLKPENVFLGGPDEDRVKVVDFGVAKLLEVAGDDDEEVLTMVGTVVGTPEYMSPEQCAGGAIDARSDVYALGVLLFQMLTCRLPFEGGTPLQIAVQQMRAPPPRLEDVLPAVDPALARVVARCLEKAPEARFASAEALHAALEPLRDVRASGQRTRSGRIMTRSSLRVQPASVRTQLAELVATWDGEHLRPEPPAEAAPARTVPVVPTRRPRDPVVTNLVLAVVTAIVATALAYWLLR